MNRKELLKKLEELGVHENNYSLDGELKLDAFILEEIHHTWKCFYMDEKGNRDYEKKFLDAADAYDYLYLLFKEQTTNHPPTKVFRSEEEANRFLLEAWKNNNSEMNKK